MKCIILAGGQGTRLRSIVNDRPKPMADIAGRPFLEFVLLGLVGKGVTEVILSIGYKAHYIERYFMESFHGMKISIAKEKSPLGTGGAVGQAVNDFKIHEPFFLLNGDTFLDFDHRELMQMSNYKKADAVITCCVVPNNSRYGKIVIANGRVVPAASENNRSKGYINAGVYLIHPRILAGYKVGDQWSLEELLFGVASSSLNLIPHITEGYFIDIGIPEDYQRAKIELPSLFSKSGLWPLNEK